MHPTTSVGRWASGDVSDIAFSVLYFNRTSIFVLSIGYVENTMTSPFDIDDLRKKIFDYCGEPLPMNGTDWKNPDGTVWQPGKTAGFGWCHTLCYRREKNGLIRTYYVQKTVKCPNCKNP